MFLICKENKQRTKTKTTKQNNTKQKRKEKGTAIHRYYDNLQTLDYNIDKVALLSAIWNQNGYMQRFCNNLHHSQKIGKSNYF